MYQKEKGTTGEQQERAWRGQDPEHLFFCSILFICYENIQSPPSPSTGCYVACGKIHPRRLYARQPEVVGVTTSEPKLSSSYTQQGGTSVEQPRLERHELAPARPAAPAMHPVLLLENSEAFIQVVAYAACGTGAALYGLGAARTNWQHTAYIRRHICLYMGTFLAA